jgi:hypothetical protein
MDPLKEFQSKEAEKLTGWVSQVLALKEARVFTVDSMASMAQRSQVSTETTEIADSPTPQVPVSESKASIPNGDVDLSGYYTKEEVDGLLEEYYTKEEIDGFFEDYYTKEEVDNALLSYPTWDETNKTYVDWETFKNFPAGSEFANAVAAIVKVNLGFEIQCNGDGTVTGKLTWAGI